MRFVPPLLPVALLVAGPAFAQAAGAPHQRTSPELSDIALFLMAVAGIWFVRRALRKRFAKPPEPTAED